MSNIIKSLTPVIIAIVFISYIFLDFFEDNKESIMSFIEYFFWKKKIKDTHNHDEDKIRHYLRNISKKGFNLSGEDIPYGRARWFIESEEDFYNQFKDTDFEFFGYSPVRSSIEEDFKEYGLLLTQYGIFEKVQMNGGDRVNVQFFPFSSLWKITINSKNEIKFYYPYGIVKQLNVTGKFKNAIKDIEDIISSGYTNDIKVDNLNDQLLKIGKNNLSSNNFINSTQIAFLSSFVLTAENRIQHIQTNSIVGNPNGHGFAAEYANNLIDRIKHPFRKVDIIGQDNALNGADRTVGNQDIQVKYCQNAKDSVRAAFDLKNDGMYRYKGMQLEVPKDQYDEALRIMGDKIREGKVEGFTNPADANKIIKKGYVTYEEAKLIAKGGNFTSIKFAVIDGTIQSLPGASISFIIIFAQAKWSGASTEEAIKLATKAGLKVLVMGTSVYVFTDQFAKLCTKEVEKVIGKKLGAELVAKRALPIVTFALIISPDLFDALVGRISSEQLLKNVVVAGGGMAAGAGAGAIGGMFGGVPGAIAGAIFGGLAGGIGVKAIADQFIVDDRVEMFAQLKEEFIDIIIVVALSEDELDKVQKAVFNDKLDNLLKNMFQKKKESRNYARDFIEKHVESVIKDREKITEKEILEAVEISKNVFVV